MDGKLVFGAPHDGSGRLVFGDHGSAGAAPDASVSIDADLPGLGTLTLRAGAVLGIDADLPGLDGTIDFVWDANVSRGGLRAEVGARWQDAAPIASGLGAAWQQGVPLRTATAARWQQATPCRADLVAPWQATTPLRAAVRNRWQQGEQRRGGLDMHWQEAERLRAAVRSHWQQASPQRAALRSHWEETQRLRSAVRGHWQQGERRSVVLATSWGAASPVHISLRTRWQEAMRPASGVSPRPGPPGPKPPCYDPATLGRLVFTDLALGDGQLVFVCHRGGPKPPPAGVVVLPRRSYIVINSVEIRRADSLSGDPLPSESFSMQLNRQSWTWSFSAAFHAAAREAVSPGLGGEPVELEVRVNGQPFRMQSERVGRSKRFPEHMVAVSGRGRAAVLDDPRVPAQTFTHALDRTAQQLMTDVLTINGVGFGWSVDFGLQDWLVPGGVWMHRGSWSSALADIAASVGGYLQPHDTDPVIRVLPLWPKPWWEWDTLAPDIELPAGMGEVEDTEVIDLPLYDRILVSGESRGVALDWTRANTAGLVLKDMALHPLITTIVAARQRGIAELSESGRMLKHKLTMPVLPQTGVIKPGTVLRYADDDAAQRIGIVRATTISEQWPVLMQSLEIDGHA